MSDALIAIVGPTATGKSNLAAHLALRFDGEVVNADSRQVYRHMDIGTAKPSKDTRRLVPHHLFDIIDPNNEFSLAQYKNLADEAIRDIHGRGKLPVVVGGTGQYVWALLEGWSVPKVPSDPSIRTKLEEMVQLKGPSILHQKLQAIDPKAAAKIDARNVRRVIRALEIYYSTGVPPSRLQTKAPRPWDILILGVTLDREELYRRADARIDDMVGSGWIEEVRALLNMEYDLELPSMSSLGYQEIGLYIKSQLSKEEALQRIKWNTHRFIRHQYTWFRLNDQRLHWLNADEELSERAVSLVSNSLPGTKGHYVTIKPKQVR